MCVSCSDRVALPLLVHEQLAAGTSAAAGRRAEVHSDVQGRTQDDTRRTQDDIRRVGAGSAPHPVHAAHSWLDRCCRSTAAHPAACRHVPPDGATPERHPRWQLSSRGSRFGSWRGPQQAQQPWQPLWQLVRTSNKPGSSTTGNWTPLHAVARCLLESGEAAPPGQLLEALRCWASAPRPEAQSFRPADVARQPLTPAGWERVPSPCPGLGAALPAVMAHSDAEAAALVAHLPGRRPQAPAHRGAVPAARRARARPGAAGGAAAPAAGGSGG